MDRQSPKDAKRRASRVRWVMAYKGLVQHSTGVLFDPYNHFPTKRLDWNTGQLTQWPRNAQSELDLVELGPCRVFYLKTSN